NGRPHIGFALEAVQGDVLRRYHALKGMDARYLSGSDENALTVVQSAEVAGVDLRELADSNATAFESIQEPPNADSNDCIRSPTRSDETARPFVQSAEVAGVALREMVDSTATAFESIQDPLNVVYNDFIRTSTNPRHFPGAQKLWRKMDEAGDIYKRHYQGN